jgi:hypothetical protein
MHLKTRYQTCSLLGGRDGQKPSMQETGVGSEPHLSQNIQMHLFISLSSLVQLYMASSCYTYHLFLNIQCGVSSSFDSHQNHVDAAGIIETNSLKSQHETRPKWSPKLQAYCNLGTCHENSPPVPVPQSRRRCILISRICLRHFSARIWSCSSPS